MRLFMGLIVAGVVVLMLLGSGFGIGFVLSWLFSSISFEMGSVIGVMTAGFTLHFVTRFMMFLEEEVALQQQQEELDDEVSYTIISSIPYPRRPRRAPIFVDEPDTEREQGSPAPAPTRKRQGKRTRQK